MNPETKIRDIIVAGIIFGGIILIGYLKVAEGVLP